jgi:hypothetical protein
MKMRKHTYPGGLKMSAPVGGSKKAARKRLLESVKKNCRCPPQGMVK